MVFVNHFCTISTVSHLYKTYALADSLRNQNREFILHVLVTDGTGDFNATNCKFWQPEDLLSQPVAKTIISKYRNAADKLRWSLKPVFLKFLLLEQTGKAIYVDNDQFFYNDYQFLYDLLNEHSILLTPHYYKHNPNKEQNWLEANYKVGLYNAGFVAAAKNGTDTLQWWAECCAYRCEKNAFRGLFDDQKYLDLVPVIDKNAHILRHKGCNVAGWNKELCERTHVNGTLQISGEYPVVFVHYNAFTIREIAENRDNLLRPLYDEYVRTLKKHKPGLHNKELLSAEPLVERLKYYIWKKATALGL